MESVALNQYIEQIRRYLPPWNAEDILKEIRSHILDQAESLAGERQTQVDETLLQEILTKLGPPKKLAAGYLQPVSLVRPEYTVHLLFYGAIAAAIFGFIGLLSAGPLGLIGYAIFSVGLCFAFFALLSRHSKIYQFPLWFPGMGIWHVEAGKSRWELGPLFGKAYWGNQKKETNMNTEKTVSRETSPQAANWEIPKKTTLWERMILKSGPRPLGPIEMWSASARIVVFTLLAIYFVFAAEPFKLLGLEWDNPRDGFHLLVTSPAIDSIRGVAVLAASLSALSGIVALLMGFCRATVISSLCSKAFWIAVVVSLLFADSWVNAEFQSNHLRLMNDWIQEGSGAFQLGSKIFLFGVLFVLAISTIGKMVRFGMVQAWHNMQEKPGARKK